MSEEIEGLFDIHRTLRRIAIALEHMLSCGVPCKTGCQVEDIIKRAEKINNDSM